MPCRSGSPQGVFGAGVWADVAGTEAEMAAPNAAAAMATVPIEPEKGARMMVLLYLNTFNCSHGNGIGFKPQPMLSPVSRTSSLTNRRTLRSPSHGQPRQAKPFLRCSEARNKFC